MSSSSGWWLRTTVFEPRSDGLRAVVDELENRAANLQSQLNLADVVGAAVSGSQPAPGKKPR
jgi:hypothetical protein